MRDKRRYLRLFAATCVAVLCIGAFAGCGSDSEDSTSTESESDTSSYSSDDTESDTGSYSSDDTKAVPV